jgi:hypothetical protein
MNHIPWIPIVEQSPADLQAVIVSQDTTSGHRTFAGWIHDGCWYSGVPMSPLYTMFGDPGIIVEMGDVRATDFWLPIPAEHPQHNVVNGGYPA